MFSFFQKKNFAKWAAIAVLALVFPAGIPGCSNGTTDKVTVPEALKASWAAGDESYIITSTTFTAAWAGESYYAGKIVNIREDDPTAGYITIKYTLNTYTPDAIGNYYVICYKNLGQSGMSLAGSSEGAGKATQAEAESEYTAANGYFDWLTDLTKS